MLLRWLVGVERILAGQLAPEGANRTSPLEQRALRGNEEVQCAVEGVRLVVHRCVNLQQEAQPKPALRAHKLLGQRQVYRVEPRGKASQLARKVVSQQRSRRLGFKREAEPHLSVSIGV